MKYLAAKRVCFPESRRSFHLFCLTLCAFSICQALWRAAVNVLPAASFDGQILLSLSSLCHEKAPNPCLFLKGSAAQHSSDGSEPQSVDVGVCWTL